MEMETKTERIQKRCGSFRRRREVTNEMMPLESNRNGVGGFRVREKGERKRRIKIHTFFDLREDTQLYTVKSKV